MVKRYIILLVTDIDERQRQFRGAMIAVGVKSVRYDVTDHAIAQTFLVAGGNIVENYLT